MSTLKKFCALCVAVATAFGAWQIIHSDAGEPSPAARPALENLESEKTTLTLQLEDLTRQRQQLDSKVSDLQAEVTRLKRELAQQRNPDAAAPAPNQTRSQKRTEDAADAPEGASPFSKAVLALAMRAAELNQQFQGNPDKEIPELQYLDEGDWLHLAKDAHLDSPDGVRKALASVRQQAKTRFAPQLTIALSNFYKNNNAQPPVSMSQLKPYFSVPVDDSTLARYQIFTDPTGKQELGSSTTIRETTAVDPEYDSSFRIGLSGWSATTVTDSYSEKFK
jgi:hypothetical protein